jgi:hypothetical protein
VLKKLLIVAGVIGGLAAIGYVALVIHTILFDDSGTA